MSLCTLPTEGVRLLVLVVLLLFQGLVVSKKNRLAARFMAAGCALDLLVGVLIPVAEITGVVVLTKSASGGTDAYMPWLMVDLFAVPMLSRLALAIHGLCLLVGLNLLIRDLPDEAREESW